MLGQLALSARCRVSPDIFVSPEASLVIADPLSTESLRGAVADLGFELVELQVSGPDSRRTMHLRIDLPGGGGLGRGVTTADCAVVSRALERQLEAAGAVGPHWRLEVSSPGIERPVRFPEHWRRYVGREVRVKVMGLPGRVDGSHRGPAGRVPCDAGPGRSGRNIRARPDSGSDPGGRLVALR